MGFHPIVSLIRGEGVAVCNISNASVHRMNVLCMILITFSDSFHGVCIDIQSCPLTLLAWNLFFKVISEKLGVLRGIGKGLQYRVLEGSYLLMRSVETYQRFRLKRVAIRGNRFLRPYGVESSFSIAL